MEDGKHRPLLSSIEDEFHNLPHDSQVHDIASYDEEEDRVGLNKPVPYFFREFYEESKKLWYLAAPAILTTVCQYSLGAITQVFAGHLGTTELATFSVENSIIAGFGYGFMVRTLHITMALLPKFKFVYIFSQPDKIFASIWFHIEFVSSATVVFLLVIDLGVGY